MLRPRADPALHPGAFLTSCCWPTASTASPWLRWELGPALQQNGSHFLVRVKENLKVRRPAALRRLPTGLRGRHRSLHPEESWPPDPAGNPRHLALGRRNQSAPHPPSDQLKSKSSSVSSVSGNRSAAEIDFRQPARGASEAKSTRKPAGKALQVGRAKQIFEPSEPPWQAIRAWIPADNDESPTDPPERLEPNHRHRFKSP